jgi:putative Mg2+ transporter-C (MgtC) family protein
VLHFPGQLDLAARILLAAALGGLIGLERELSGHPAGLRTHIAVALGASLFAVLSAFAWGGLQAGRNATNVQIDVSRIASQIVVGVGFLGGGAILKDGLGVRGLTTAASLWVTAAIGTAVGLGSWIVACVTTLAFLASIVLLRPIRWWLRHHLGRDRSCVVIRLRPEADPAPVVADLVSLDGTRLKSLEIEHAEGRTVLRAMVLSARGGRLDEEVAGLADRAGVSEVTVE